MVRSSGYWLLPSGFGRRRLVPSPASLCSLTCVRTGVSQETSQPLRASGENKLLEGRPGGGHRPLQSGPRYSPQTGNEILPVSMVSVGVKQVHAQPLLRGAKMCWGKEKNDDSLGHIYYWCYWWVFYHMKEMFHKAKIIWIFCFFHHCREEFIEFAPHRAWCNRQKQEARTSEKWSKEFVSKSRNVHLTASIVFPALSGVGNLSKWVCVSGGAGVSECMKTKILTLCPIFGLKTNCFGGQITHFRMLGGTGPLAPWIRQRSYR